MVDPIRKAEEFALAALMTLMAAGFFALAIGVFISALLLSWFAIKSAWLLVV